MNSRMILAYQANQSLRTANSKNDIFRIVCPQNRNGKFLFVFSNSVVVIVVVECNNIFFFSFLGYGSLRRLPPFPIASCAPLSFSQSAVLRRKGAQVKRQGGGRVYYIRNSPTPLPLFLFHVFAPMNIKSRRSPRVLARRRIKTVHTHTHKKPLVFVNTFSLVP